MGRLMRAHDWDATPLGPPGDWPPVLRTLVDLMLSSSQPMFVVWGPERTTLYNDAYAAVLAGKHPALGRPLERIWPEIWESDLAPIVARAYAGEALHMDDIPLTMMRKGYPEETHFSFSYTPVRGPDGVVQGFFCPCLEITEQVLEERRARLRAALTERLRTHGEPAAFIDEAVALLARHLGAEQAVYAEIDESGEIAVVARDWNDGAMSEAAGRHRMRDYGPALVADLEAGRSLAVGDVREDPRTSAPEALEAFARRGVRAFLSVPHLRDGRLAAVLAVHAAEARHWHPADVALLAEAAERVNLAVERARAEAARHASEERLREARDALALATAASRLGWGTWDFATGAITLDATGRRIVGLGEGEDTIAAWFERTHPEDRAALDAEVRACLGEGRPFDLEYRVVHADGTERHVHGTGLFQADEAGAPAYGTGFVRDVTEQKRAEQRQEMLIAELDHRVKNVLAVMQSIVRQSLGRGRDAGAEAAERLTGRIDALARSHTLLARSRWEGARFADLVEGAVAPYRGEGAGRVVVEGPDLKVRPKAAQTLTLALHELVTNAAKHGALSREEGRVSALWRLEGEGDARRLVFEWRERGGPAIEAPPERRGFGSRLIERTLAYELDGAVTLDFSPGGLGAVIDLPLDGLLAEPGRGDPGRRRDEAPPAGARTAPGRPRVFVVEDEHLVGEETAAALRSAGCRVTGPVGTLDEALRIAVAEGIDAAILDVNLDGRFVWPAARALRARGIPFAFATGYSDTIAVPPDLSDTPWIEKPLAVERLVSTLVGLLEGAAG